MIWKQTQNSFDCASREIFFFIWYCLIKWERTQDCVASTCGRLENHYALHAVRSTTRWARQTIRGHSHDQSSVLFWVVWADKGTGWIENTHRRVVRVRDHLLASGVRILCLQRLIPPPDTSKSSPSSHQPTRSVFITLFVTCIISQ